MIQPQKGYIWFYKGLHYGSYEDLMIFHQQWPELEILFTFDEVNLPHIKIVADNIRKSNLYQLLQQKQESAA